MQAFFLGSARTNARTKQRPFRPEHSRMQGIGPTEPAPEQEAIDGVAEALPPSGVTGNQAPGSTEVIELTPPPAEGLQLTRTVMGVVARRPENYGGEDMAAILGAVISDSTHDKDHARHLLAEKQSRLDAVTEELHAVRLKNTQLAERLGSVTKLGNFQKICTFFSPIAFSLALEILKTNTYWALIVAALGLTLLASNFYRMKGVD